MDGTVGALLQRVHHAFGSKDQALFFSKSDLICPFSKFGQVSYAGTDLVIGWALQVRAR